MVADYESLESARPHRAGGARGAHAICECACRRIASRAASHVAARHVACR